MDDEPQNVTSQSTNPVEPVKTPSERPQPFWARFWWVPAAFIVPFVVIFEFMGGSAHSNIAACARSGGIGLCVAALIYTLWLIDQKIQNQRKAPIGPLIGMMGMMLWLSWVIAAHVMVIASDDAHYLAESETH